VYANRSLCVPLGLLHPSISLLRLGNAAQWLRHGMVPPASLSLRTLDYAQKEPIMAVKNASQLLLSSQSVSPHWSSRTATMY
jgi:hypothetical protein